MTGLTAWVFPGQGAQEGIEGPCVCPPSLEDAVTQAAVGQIQVVDVGDFQLSPGRGLQSADAVEHPGIIHVKTSDRVTRLRLLGLFLNADDFVAFKHRDAEPLRVRNLFQNHVRALA